MSVEYSHGMGIPSVPLLKGTVTMTTTANTKPKSEALTLAVAATTPTAEHVQAAAKVKGAATGKDAVPAGINWQKALLGEAQKESGFILSQINLMGDRMDCWRAVGAIASKVPYVKGATKDSPSVNPVLQAYPKLVYREMLVKAGLSDEQINGARELWPDAVKELYKRHISKRISETRLVCANLNTAMSRTMQVLNGPGTTHQKLVALPNVSSKGRKAGTANADKGGTIPPKHVAGGVAEQISALLKDATFQTLALVADMVRFNGVQLKGNKIPTPFLDLIKQLGTATLQYQNAMARLDDAKSPEAKAA